MANLRLLYSGLGLIICSCKEEERSLRGAVLAGEAVWRASLGAWLSNCALWPSLLLTGCELETYFGLWHANELTKCPSSLSASISHMGEHWKLRKNFRGTYICKDLYTCVCLPTHTWGIKAPLRSESQQSKPRFPREGPVQLTSEFLPFAFLILGSSAPAPSASAALPRWTSVSAAAACCVFLLVPRRNQGRLWKTWAEAHERWPAGNASQWQSPRHWQVTLQGWQMFT